MSDAGGGGGLLGHPEYFRRLAAEERQSLAAGFALVDPFGGTVIPPAGVPRFPS